MESENGVSHFLEHMAFKGTERRTAAQIAEEIEAVGGHINAYTAREQTAYYVKVLKEDTALAADIIGDILTHSTFEPEELERERGVILQEIGQANDTPDDIIFDHFQETAYPVQPLGRPVLGTEEGIRADAARHADRLHAPALRGVQRRGRGRWRAGPRRRSLDLVQQHFADLPRDPAPAMLPARYGGGEFREARDLDQVHIVLGFPSVGYGDPRLLPDAAALHPAGRRHVVAAVPGGAGEARAGLLDLLVQLAVHGRRTVRHLRRHRRERGRGADAGHAGGAAQGAERGDRDRSWRGHGRR